MAGTNLSQSGSTSAVKVYVNVNEISTNGNYRTLYMSVCAYPEDGYGHLDRDGTWEFYFEGETDDSGSAIINDGGMWMFESSSVEVYVEPGTTVANVNISFSATLKSPSAGNKTVTGTITRITGLSMVADTSITSVKDIYFGDKCSVVFTPASSSFHYRLQFSMGDYKYTTGVISPYSTSAYTYTGLTIPESEAVNIPNSDYGTVAVSLTQYSDSAGTATVGAASVKSFRITLKDTVVPSITSHSVSIDNSSNSVLNSWGVPLAGYTKLNVKASASGIYGSTIKTFSISGAYRATVSGASLDYTGKVIGTSGNKAFTITCTDSRGRVSSQVVTNSVTLLPYSAPKLTKLSVKKEDYGDSDASNDRMVATATWTYNSVDGHNSATGKLYYKISTAEDWTAHRGTLRNNTAFTITEFTPDEEVSYNFKVVVTDALGVSSEKEAFSSTTRVLMDYQAGGMGLGIGKICEIDNVANDTQSLEISMDSYFFGEVFIRDKTQTLEDYIRSITKYLVEYEDYGDDNPNSITWETPPKAGQIYYMRIQEG